MDEMYEAMKAAIDDLNNLTSVSIDHFNMSLTDCFPCESYRIITIGEKTYRIKTTVEMTEI